MLTDSDREAIAAVVSKFKEEVGETGLVAEREAIYIAGLLAGIERAAKDCADNECPHCAAAIRAIK